MVSLSEKETLFGVIVSFPATKGEAFLTCGVMVSFFAKETLFLGVIFTAGVWLELSFVQAAKHIAIAKADKVSFVKFFTFVLFNYY